MSHHNLRHEFVNFNMEVPRNINNNLETLRNIRNQLFPPLFIKASIAYARTFPPPVRRLFEFLILIKALGALFILVYIHMAFYSAGCQCLDHVKDTWPRDGILRVELIRNADTLHRNSFENALQNQTNVHFDDYYAVPLMNPELAKRLLRSELNDTKDFCDIDEKRRTRNYGCCYETSYPNFYIDDACAGPTAENCQTSSGDEACVNAGVFKMQQTEETEADHMSKEEISEMEMLANAIWQEDEYIFEYALEYGLLRLSSKARKRLKVPIFVVKLDPTEDDCFGDALSKLILEEFLGYNDILISCMKRIATNEDNKGYLRNVLTGEHYQFIHLWVCKTSIIYAAFTMIIFTLSVSMLLRYSHHQVFVFIVDLLQMLEFNTTLSFPTAPFLTVILASVGMEAIMTEFFNETTIALYIILIVWVSDQFQAVCCRTRISKKHWPRFFFLYHFAFYAYHCQFNGQYYGLALVTSWLFIQHSMLYFFHHYELPAILAHERNNREFFNTPDEVEDPADAQETTDDVETPQASNGDRQQSDSPVESELVAELTPEVISFRAINIVSGFSQQSNSNGPVDVR